MNEYFCIWCPGKKPTIDGMFCKECLEEVEQNIEKHEAEKRKKLAEKSE